MAETEIIVVSGGTATNSLVSLFQSLSKKVSYVLPISDNGGSTSEILRVLGGPAIGDIRSRITRLITDEGFQVLLSYRLSEDPQEAKDEWTLIVEGTHEIWNGIEPQCKEMVRSFLIHVHMELLKKSRNPSTNFSFELASIGNLLLTGVRLFVGSLDSAIELILRMTRVDPGVRVIPCLNTNYTYHISASLKNGDIITGQSQISHPNETNVSVLGSTTSVNFYEQGSHITQDEDIPYQHPDLLISQLKFSKEVTQPLKSPIERIFYINPYGEEIHPKANSRTIKIIGHSKMIVYSIGSLMTSIIPVLILQGIGHAIRTSRSKKVLLLNGDTDRETFGMSAVDFIKTVHKALRYSFGEDPNCLKFSDIITHLMYLEDCEIPVDVKSIEKMGIRCIKIKRDTTLSHEVHLYDLGELQHILQNVLHDIV
jgi:2-phospho-L-lactate transferase/gluconeogenesis factor (CofD/UPF0052 family)